MNYPKDSSHGVAQAMMLALLCILVASQVSAQDSPADAKANPLKTEVVKRGDLALVIHASGTIEPQEVADVSAAVAGIITSFGPDPRAATDPQFKGKSIDYNSPVEAGTLLAQLDDRRYPARVDEAQAGCQRAQAELDGAKAKLELADADLKRIQGSVDNKTVPAAEAKTAEIRHRVAKSAVTGAAAALAEREAVLTQAQINLAATSIRSPVKGVVIDRRVNVWQAVETSLNSPSLFLIAKDTKHLQIWASVNEADIGAIHEKQSVRFTVGAFLGKVFEGQVAQIRLNAQMTQNVVTYTVVITADNPDGKLLPYLTANVEFDAGHRDHALLVPNAALRWQPASKTAIAGVEAGPAREGANVGGGHRQRVWIQEGQSVRPVNVEIGLSDGATTEIAGGDLKEGARVVVGEDSPNPFAPHVKKDAEP
ncbi:MAG TPA: HlyD family efflux transporter periplasmic adaptor subunit [Pirellulales bacterium]|jgi:HlyD family secretion protein|nr:HlyD family efflux transporter periplasmic adaptor subunit [Pirellulales bacterium]